MHLNYNHMGVDHEVMRQIIDHIYEGNSCESGLKKYEIKASAFHKTLSECPELDDEYSRAQAARSHLHADQVVEIADTDPDPQRARNRMEARKWHASKMNPKKYGDRLDVNVSQIVDIGSALEKARQRTALPPRYPHSLVTQQVTKMIEDTQRSAADEQSGAQEIRDAIEIPELISSGAEGEE
jgi:hypothetical protein